MADTSTQQLEDGASNIDFGEQLPFHNAIDNPAPPPPPPTDPQLQNHQPFQLPTTQTHAIPQIQDFGALFSLMQHQIQGQNIMYQTQMESLQRQQTEQLNQQKLQMETILSQNRTINELKHELERAKDTKSNEHANRPERPTINAGLSDNQWLLFQDSWGRYKQLANLSKPDRIRNELRAACSQEVNETLFELHGPHQLNIMSEAELLEAIQKVSVESVHEEVHRQSFFQIKQDIGEPINKFVARLKAKANLCNFKVEINCAHEPTTGKHTVSFSEAMLGHQLISGLADEEWKAKLLSEADTLTTFAKKFDRLLSLEAVGKNTPQLGTNQQIISKTALSKSAYKKGKQQAYKVTASKPTDQQPQPQCFFCGQAPHERKDCPASRKNCSKCGKTGHFASVCQSSKRMPSRTAVLESEPTQESAPMPAQQPSMTSAAFCPAEVFRPGLEGGSFL